MAEIDDLDTTDANNTGRFPEGQDPSTVNDGARALEGMLARAWFDAIEPTSITASASTSNAWNITPNRSITCAQGLRLCFVAPAGNSGAVTIDIGDGKGAHALEQANGSAFSGGEIPKDQFVEAMFEASASVWQALNYAGMTPSSTDTLTNKTISNADNTLTFANAQTFSGQLTNSISGSAVVPAFKRTDAHGTGVSIFQADFTGKDDGGAEEVYARMGVWVDDDTNGSEDSHIYFQTHTAGTLTNRLRIYNGLVMNGATGGDQGAGTINATAIYKNGSEIGAATVESSQATTSGSSFNFTGLSGASVIWVSLDGCSTDSTDGFLVQLGDSGGIESSGYTSHSENIASTGNATSSSGFVVGEAPAAASAWYGRVRLVHIGSNTWVSDHFISNGADTVYGGGGTKTLSGALTQLTFTRTGSANFDAGSVGVAWL